MVVTSPLTKWIFYFDENGLFQRGRIYMLQALTILVYILLTSMLATRRAVTQKTAFEKQNCLSLIFFIIPPAIASVVQQFNHNAPITVMGLSIAVYYVYLNMLDSQVYNDSLTGLNNRRRARYYLLDSLELADTKPFVVFMIDVDYFKTINDKYGHSEGDRALCVVADSLKDTADQYDGFAARMGGDEFLLSMNYTPGVIPEHIADTIQRHMMNHIREKNLPYELKVSVGYMVCSSKKTLITDLLAKADEMQYKSKREHHEKNSGQ